MSIRRDQVVSLAERVADLLPGTWDIEPFPADWGRAGARLREHDTQAILIIGESQEYADSDSALTHYMLRGV
jgi:hypothetical protein